MILPASVNRPSKGSQTPVLAWTLCGQCAPERLLGDEVHEAAPALELDHRQVLAVGGLERLVAGDVDLDELERLLLAHTQQHLARAVAEVAAGRVEEGDSYGYSPRVIVAWATRCTASP
jgi:hypothetical protein